MIVTITGSRDWTDREYIFGVLDDFIKFYGVTGLRCGCARGADRIAGWPCPEPLRTWPRKAPEPPVGWAASRGIPVDHYPARWDAYGKIAGPFRNDDMLKGRHDPCEVCGISRHTGDIVCACEPVYPNVVLAFHESINTSKGTGDMVKRTQRAGVTNFNFPNMEVPLGFDFERSLLWEIIPTGNAPNAEDMKLW